MATEHNSQSSSQSLLRAPWFRGQHTLTHVSEPYVLERASALALDTVTLIPPDNDITQGCTVLEDEDVAIALRLHSQSALEATVELLATKVL